MNHLIPLTDESARIHSTGLDDALAHNTVAAHLLGVLPPTLEAAADLSAGLTQIHELDPGARRGRAADGGSSGRPALERTGRMGGDT
ncbi:hypothetical protein [Streptomyces cyaneus]|uniref:hypothetical protein n=1 Tax=Streptomyces cyaneus TaxID=1904 RepID=UPI00142EAA29